MHTHLRHIGDQNACKKGTNMMIVISYFKSFWPKLVILLSLTSWITKSASKNNSLLGRIMKPKNDKMSCLSQHSFARHAQKCYWTSIIQEWKKLRAKLVHTEAFSPNQDHIRTKRKRKKNTMHTIWHSLQDWIREYY